MKKLIAAASVLAITVSSLASARTPLELRQGSGAAASDSSSPSTVGWKLGGIAVVIAGVAVWMRKRRTALPGRANETCDIRVISRTSVGGRSELLVVDIGDQRVLLGATPTAIRHIADIDRPDPDRLEPVRVQADPPPADVPTRFRALIDSAIDTSERERVSLHEREPIETQAKNLLQLRRKL